MPIAKPAAFIAALLVCASSVHAQDAGMPTEIEWKLAEIGAVIAPAPTAALYAPLHKSEPYAGVRIERDVAYGTDPRQALDVFVPEAAAGDGKPRGVLMFVHGGGFVAGNKRTPGGAFFDNVMLLAAGNGLIGVNVTYRLAPQHPWPAAAEDVGAAVRWVGENIAARGGDPARVVVMGHSAGAVHVAGYIAHARFHTPKGIGLAGAILVSGLYDFARTELGPAAAYFGTRDIATGPAAMLPGLAAAMIPMLVVHAELDPSGFIEQAKLLGETLCQQGKCPTQVTLPKHSHTSQIYALNTADTSLSAPLLAFVGAIKEPAGK